MNTQRNWTIVGMGLVWSIVLMVVPCMAQPVNAISRAGAPDVAKIDAFVRGQVERHGIPGLALAVVEGDQIIQLGGYGTADRSGRAVTPQTPFVIASASKPLTALAVMQLVEAGKVALDVSVQRYLPEFRVADPVASQQITVRHLLLHTTGIPATACDTRVGAQTLEQFVAELRTVKLEAPVGAQHGYCSANYNVLGRIVEVVSGQSFGVYMQQHVFMPLAMRHSFAAKQEAERDGLAQNYQWFFGLQVPGLFPYNPSQVPSGFLMASAEDLAHFLIAQLNGGRFGGARVLSPQGIAAMQVGGVSRGAGRGEYGLGWQMGSIGGVRTVGHDGTHPDARAFMFMEPGTRRGAVLLMNANSIPLAEVTAYTELHEGVARLLAGQEPVPASSLSLRTLYLIVDAVLGGLLALAIWPLLRLGHWEQRLRQLPQVGRWHRVRIGLRLVAEFAMPLTLLLVARLLLGSLGGQSWREGFVAFPDVSTWVWLIALTMLLTGAIRLVFLLRVLRHTAAASRMAAPIGPTSQRPT